MRQLSLAIVLSSIAWLGPPARAVPTPVPIVPRALWDTSTPVPYAGRPQQVRRIIIHHDAVDYPAGESGEQKTRRLLRAAREHEGWPDVPYHYLVDRDGRIFAGRPEQYAGDTHSAYDPSDALHIALLGNYDHLEPTDTQIAALVALIRSKARHYGVPPDAIVPHGAAALTDCPGANLRRRLAGAPWR